MERSVESRLKHMANQYGMDYWRRSLQMRVLSSDPNQKLGWIPPESVGEQVNGFKS